jgi:hypothetical protein
MEQNQYTQYLKLKVRTVEKFPSKGEQKQHTEIHEVRVFGQLGRFMSDTTQQGDTIYCEGALKSFDKKFYINVKSIQIIIKANGLLPPEDVDRRYPQRKV